MKYLPIYLALMLVLLLGLEACGTSAPAPAAVTLPSETVATRTLPRPSTSGATVTSTGASPTGRPSLTPTSAATVPPSPTVTATAQPSPTAAAPEVASADADVFDRGQLIADVRQLAQILEDTHPDPYSRGGGKVAFYHRLDGLLNAIPPEGMSRDGFIQLLRPFVAAVGDSHTEIWSDYAVSEGFPNGVPLRFGIVEESLYVAASLREQHRYLIGSVLVAVEGVPISELLSRQRRLVPLENVYHELENMASETLWYGPYLQDVLPEWETRDEISVTLRRPRGEVEEVAFTLPIPASRSFRAETAVELPTTPSCGFTYAMLDFPTVGEEIAYLRVDHMQLFREDREAVGEPGTGVPSATDTFRRLVVDMAEGGTETLIVDLRYNGGGSSMMADILIYFMYGKEALHTVKNALYRDGGQVDRYSALCYTPPNHVGITLDQVNEGRAVPLVLGEYDFRSFNAGDAEDFEAFLARMETPPYVQWYQNAPTFFSEYESEAYAGYYLPDKVLVLVSPWTFSSGFTMARQLYRAGAVLIGTPSAQASNAFGNGLLWRLDNTRIEGQVTRSYFVIFPEDSGLGEVLPVHFPLSYERLAGYNFDPNATFLYALELLPTLGD